MRLHFYKLQIGGNTFCLIEDEQIETLKPADLQNLSIKLCNRRFGVGASGCMLLSKDNTLRVYNPSGEMSSDASDAYMCAARFAFDSGKVTRLPDGSNAIVFKTLKGDVKLNVISSREFSLDLGSPFSLVSGKLLTPDSSGSIENYTIDEKPICLSGIHIKQSVLVAFPTSQKSFSFFEFYLKLRHSFQKQKVYLVFAHPITKETISIRTLKHGLSTSCASAAAALIASWYAGSCDKAAVCTFEYGSPSIWQQQEKLSADKDDSKKITILWENEIRAIGTGGYLFEGYYDYEVKNA